jgi:hypothetical protein
MRDVPQGAHFGLPATPGGWGCRKLRLPYPPLRPYRELPTVWTLGSPSENYRLCGLYLVEVGKIYFLREAARVFSALGRHWFNPGAYPQQRPGPQPSCYQSKMAISTHVRHATGAYSHAVAANVYMYP